MVNQIVAKTLRDRRLALGLRQHELARLLRISVFALNRIEAGTRSFEASLLPRLPSSIAQPVIDLLEYEILQTQLRLTEFRRTGCWNKFIRRRPPGLPFSPAP